MKPIARILTALLALCLMIPAALAEEPERSLTVTGAATVTVPADTAVISLAVETTATDVTTAMRKNAELIDAVLTALKNEGVAEDDLITERFYISTVYDYNSMEARIKGYSVLNGLSVTVRDMTQVGHLIDIAFAAGANQCNGVNVTSTKAGEASDEALTAAIAEGKRKAELMASAAGYVLGDLIRITEGGSYSGAVYTSAKSITNEDMGTQIIADGQSFSATVTLVFTLE